MIKWFAGIIVAGVVSCAAAITLSDEIRWRAEVVFYRATGQIEGVGWGDLLSMLKPGSGFYLRNLADTKNPYSAIENLATTDDDVRSGEARYRAECSTCHGNDGAGSSAPALNTGNFKHGDSDWSLFQVIRHGVEGTPMQPHALPSEKIWQIVSYLRSLEDVARAHPIGVADTAAALAPTPVTYQRIAAAVEPHNWLTYSGSYSGFRYSPLNQIDAENANQVQVKWMVQFDTDQMIEATPIVNDGVMYVTEPPSIVHALNASTGANLWTYTHRIPTDVAACCGLVNRGVAALDDQIFLATIDAKLIALDAATGKARWQTEIADYKSGVTVTGAPLAIRDKVIVGVSGGDMGIRGFLDAYDAKTGKRLWRYYTIPAEGEPGNETWGANSWKKGGAPTWLTGSFDPELNLVYWGVGNPGPDYQADVRPGDNLYSDCVVALNADTGKLVWYFQFTPNDEHDWDANQIPILIDAKWKGVAQSF